MYDTNRIYLLSQKLKTISEQINKLSEEEKKLVIERADEKNGLALKELYDSLNDYIGW